MKTPEIIFLQWHGDCHPEDCSNDDDVDPSGASWYWEQIFPADIEYIRMDKFNEVTKQRDEWQRQAEEIITERNKLETQRDELLEAIKSLYGAIDCCHDLTPDLLRKVSAVIAKAEG